MEIMWYSFCGPVQRQVPHRVISDGFVSSHEKTSLPQENMRPWQEMLTDDHSKLPFMPLSKEIEPEMAPRPDWGQVNSILWVLGNFIGLQFNYMSAVKHSNKTVN